MSPDDASDEQRERAFKIVYDEAIRALNLQRAGIDSLRARVGFLVSAAAISTSFLGGLALTGRTGDAGSWAAIGLFVAFGAVSLRVLWPRAMPNQSPELEPSPKPKPLVEGPSPMRPFPGDDKRKGEKRRWSVPGLRALRRVVSRAAGS